MRNLFLLLPWIWLFSIWGVTAYAVFWMGHSGWWFLLTAFISDPSSRKDKKCKCSDSTDEKPHV